MIKRGCAGGWNVRFHGNTLGRHVIVAEWRTARLVPVAVTNPLAIDPSDGTVAIQADPHWFGFWLDALVRQVAPAGLAVPSLGERLL